MNSPYKVWAAAGGAGLIQDASLAIVAAGARAIALSGGTAVMAKGDTTISSKALVKMIDGRLVVTGQVEWAEQVQAILDEHG